MEESHLLPQAEKLMKLSNAQRIERIKRGFWVGYGRAQQALQKLEELLSHPEHIRMPNLLMIGSTNNGKSMIIDKFIRTKKAKIISEVEAENIPVICIQMPASPSVRQFYGMILYKLNVPQLYGSVRLGVLEVKVIQLLKKIKIKLLIIDELHNLLGGKSDRRQEFLNLLRFLGNELRIPLVGVGTKEAYLAIRSDEQLENRFEPFLLPRWQLDNEYLSLLKTFISLLPLKKASPLTKTSLAMKILSLSEGIIGEIVKILTLASIKAIETGHERIDEQLLKSVTYQSPMERRQMFERFAV